MIGIGDMAMAAGLMLFARQGMPLLAARRGQKAI